MSKAPVDIIKYVIHAEAEAKGLVEKPDLIGAIFGQTEGLLGEDLDLRELQKSGRIGRIDADLETKKGVTNAKVTIPSSLDMVETSIIAAGVETITRVGPCDATFKISKVEDVREAKRKAVVDRARDILQTFMSSGLPDSREISEGIRDDLRGGEITKYKGLDAGPGVADSEELIIVEGRADVLNLLRNGIKNAIAVGGIKIPEGIVGITKDKETTVFVDGDRGGDLILKSLKNAKARIDYVARAPTGREVEGLARKEVVMSLRRKKSADDAFKDLGRDSKKSNDRSEPRSRNDSRRDSKSRSSRSDSRRSSRSDSKNRERRSDDRRSRSSDRPSREPVGKRQVRIEEPGKSSEGAKLLESLAGIKNQALLMDKDFKEIKKVDLDVLKKEKDLKKAHALVIDDIITNDVMKLAEKCKYVAGITTAGNLNVPSDKIVVTKF
jgi:DNA primase